MQASHSISSLPFAQLGPSVQVHAGPAVLATVVPLRQVPLVPDTKLTRTVKPLRLSFAGTVPPNRIRCAAQHDKRSLTARAATSAEALQQLAAAQEQSLDVARSPNGSTDGNRAANRVANGMANGASYKNGAVKANGAAIANGLVNGAANRSAVPSGAADSSSSYLGMWKRAKEREEDARREQQAQAAMDEAERRAVEEEEAAMGRRQQEFSSILQVSPEERAPIEKELIVDRAVAALAAAEALMADLRSSNRSRQERQQKLYGNWMSVEEEEQERLVVALQQQQQQRRQQQEQEQKQNLRGQLQPSEEQTQQQFQQEQQQQQPLHQQVQMAVQVPEQQRLQQQQQFDPRQQQQQRRQRDLQRLQIQQEQEEELEQVLLQLQQEEQRQEEEMRQRLLKQQLQKRLEQQRRKLEQEKQRQLVLQQKLQQQQQQQQEEEKRKKEQKEQETLLRKQQQQEEEQRQQEEQQRVKQELLRQQEAQQQQQLELQLRLQQEESQRKQAQEQEERRLWEQHLAREQQRETQQREQRELEQQQQQFYQQQQQEQRQQERLLQQQQEQERLKRRQVEEAEAAELQSLRHSAPASAATSGRATNGAARSTHYLHQSPPTQTPSRSTDGGAYSRALLSRSPNSAASDAHLYPSPSSSRPFDDDGPIERAEFVDATPQNGAAKSHTEQVNSTSSMDAGHHAAFEADAGFVPRNGAARTEFELGRSISGAAEPLRAADALRDDAAVARDRASSNGSGSAKTWSGVSRRSDADEQDVVSGAAPATSVAKTDSAAKTIAKLMGRSAAGSRPPSSVKQAPADSGRLNTSFVSREPTLPQSLPPRSVERLPTFERLPLVERLASRQPLEEGQPPPPPPPSLPESPPMIACGQWERRAEAEPAELPFSSGRGTTRAPGPDFWSWAPPLMGRAGAREEYEPLLQRAAARRTQADLMFKERGTTSTLELPMESSHLSGGVASLESCLPPLQSLAEFVDLRGFQDQSTIVPSSEEARAAQWKPLDSPQRLSVPTTVASPTGSSLTSSANETTRATPATAMQSTSSDESATSGISADGSQWWKESGVEQTARGEVCHWTVLRGVSPDGRAEWEEKWWEVYDEFGYKEMGAEKSGRNASGAVWRETWKEATWQDVKTGLSHIEKLADKSARDALGGEWREKWGERYDALGRADKWADKWRKVPSDTELEEGHAHEWGEKWGEKFDGRGASTKYSDKWARRCVGADQWVSWGDKWDEKFDMNARGQKYGETWWEGEGGKRWNRTWGEDHNASGTVKKYGRSSSGEHWDTHVQMATEYESKPRFGFKECLENSRQLLDVGRNQQRKAGGKAKNKL